MNCNIRSRKTSVKSVANDTLTVNISKKITQVKLWILTLTILIQLNFDTDTDLCSIIDSE